MPSIDSWSSPSTRPLAASRRVSRMIGQTGEPAIVGATLATARRGVGATDAPGCACAPAGAKLGLALAIVEPVAVIGRAEAVVARVKVLETRGGALVQPRPKMIGALAQIHLDDVVPLVHSELDAPLTIVRGVNHVDVRDLAVAAHATAFGRAAAVPAVARVIAWRIAKVSALHGLRYGLEQCIVCRKLRAGRGGVIVVVNVKDSDRIRALKAEVQRGPVAQPAALGRR